MKFFITSLFLFSVPLVIAKTGAVQTVCFATINSSEEKETFTKNLSTGLNKGKFKFVELTDFAGKDDDEEDQWLEAACKKGIQCDVLAISGHFGGTFFGEKGDLELPIDTIQKLSCQNKCANILSKPKEVFLFGCNTLAGKEQDRRTPEQYLQVLLNDGIDPETAQRSVDRRYSPTGSSFKEIMQRSFIDVPHLYGFNSIGPSGKNIEPMLKKYFQGIPDYAAHLESIEAKRNSVMACQDMAKWCSDNSNLASCLKVTAFTQCSGASSLVKNNFRDNVCHLTSEDTDLDEKIKILTKIAKDGQLADYMENFEEITRDDEDDEIFKDQNIVAALQEIKKSTTETLGNFSRFGFFHKANIISKNDLETIQGRIIKNALLNLTRGTIDTLYDVLWDGREEDKIKFKFSLSPQEVSKILNNEDSFEILHDISFNSVELYDGILNAYNKIDKKNNKVEYLLGILAKDQRHKSFIMNECNKALRNKVRNYTYNSCASNASILLLATENIDLYKLVVYSYFNFSKLGYFEDSEYLNTDFSDFTEDLSEKIATTKVLQDILVDEIIKSKTELFDGKIEDYSDALVGNEKILILALKKLSKYEKIWDNDEENDDYISTTRYIIKSVFHNPKLFKLAQPFFQEVKKHYNLDLYNSDDDPDYTVGYYFSSAIYRYLAEIDDKYLTQQEKKSRLTLERKKLLLELHKFNLSKYFNEAIELELRRTFPGSI